MTATMVNARRLAVPRQLDCLGRLLARWRYSSDSTRDPRLDLLRGAFVVAMLVDHLGGTSWFHTITGGNRFYVSAAEGFVLLSGLVMGLVYARLIARDGLGRAVRRVARRAATLYLLAVALNVGFRLLSSLAGASWAEHTDSLGSFALDVVRLRQTYYLSDVLMLYPILVLLAVPALVLLARGQARLLLLGSAGVWGLHQLGLTEPVDRLVSGLGIFPPTAWQLIFMVGLATGYHWRALRRRASPVPWPLAGAALATAAAGLIGLSILAPDSALAEPVASFFGKDALRPGRLLAAAVFFPLLFVLATLVWRPLAAGLGWLLLPLGQRALLAYSLHLGVVLAANIRLNDVPGYALDEPLPNSLAHLGAVMLLWGGVRLLPRGWELGSAGIARAARWGTAAWQPARLPLAAGLAALVLVSLTVLQVRTGLSAVALGKVSLSVLLEQEERAGLAAVLGGAVLASGTEDAAPATESPLPAATTTAPAPDGRP